MQPSKRLPTLNPSRALAKLCERRFFRFFCELWETIEAVELIPNWHIEYICNELQNAYEIWETGESQDDILINLPPGMSKSTMVTQLFPAWLWVRNQSIRVISSSYAADLSTAHAVKTRDVLDSDKFKLLWPGLIKFKSDTAGKTHYKNTNMGERFVTSTGGRVTGMHGDFILIDDPINPESSASEADLIKANRFVSRTLSTRKTDKKRSVTIMVMQRLSEKDPAGTWIKTKKKLRHICLPGKLSGNINPPELVNYYLNGLLDANRLDDEALTKLQEDLGSYGFAGQIQQQTTPEGGGIWKPEWFTQIPDMLMPTVKQMTSYGTDWDTAYSESESNAASAAISSGIFNGKMYIDQFGYFFKEFPDLIKEMREWPDPHYIEAKASGKSAKQTLTAAKIPAIEVQVNSDKTARAQDATPKAEAGMICVRKSIFDRLMNDSVQGVAFFPRGEKQDVADTLAQAIIRHFGKSTIIRPRTSF